MQYDALMRKAAVVLGLLLAVSVRAASTPELVRDFDRTPDSESSSPEFLFSNGERAFFFAADGHGQELWTSDGTPAGTRMVADLEPGPGPDRIHTEPNFVASGDLVYFWHRNDFAGETWLWRTDGTPQGTFPVFTGTFFSSGERVVPFGERGVMLYSNELVVIDGETARSVGTDASFFVAANVNGIVYGLYDDTLWRTDGTAAGTREVFEFEGDVDPEQLVVHDGALWLVVEHPTNDDVAGVWRSDGTAAGTRHVASLRDVEATPRLVAIDSGVFALVTSGSSTHLMRIGDTGASLVLVTPGTIGSNSFLAPADDFFVFETGQPDRIYRSDGTLAGTAAIVADGIDEVALAGELVVYEANGDVWVHDGTSARRILEDQALDLSVAAVGDRFLLAADHAHSGREPWVSDGTAAGTALLKNIRSDTDSGGSLAHRIGDAIFFRARGDETGMETWVIDDAGLRALDFIAGPASSNPRVFTAIGDKLLYLSDRRSNHPAHFIVTDGDGLSSIMLYDFEAHWPNDFASFPVIGDRVFLFGNGVTGDEVWTTDGTLESTRSGASLPYVDGDFDPVAANGVVFFVGPNDALWRTDGTTAGTYALASDVVQLHATPSRLFFIARSSAFGAELWVSDGTLAGTHLLKDVHVGDDGAFTDWFDYDAILQTVGDGIVFAAADGVHGLEPWFSDGTEAGTFLLRDIAAGEASSMLPRYDRELTATAGGFVYFAADDGTRGRELWRTDGTTEGTHLVRDIARGRASSSPSHLRASGDRIYFGADDGIHGRELWRSSLAGTALVADVAEGTDSSLPHDMTERDGWIYFFATTEATGDELWRVAAPAVRRRAVAPPP